VTTRDKEPTAGRLFVVSTPIGNLGDITYRAVEVLRSVDAILAEDTRHARTLLDRYEVRVPTIAYHEHNEAKSVPRLLARLAAGERLALISDAGTPLLSDPGARLVRAAVEAGIPVEPIPGASALLAALVAAGLSGADGRWTFYGFLPRRAGERRSALAEIVVSQYLTIMYEAPTRVADLLADLVEAGAGDRRAAVARELTKQFEEIRRGTVGELAAYYAGGAPRGEVVVLLEGAVTLEPDEAVLRERVRALRAQGVSARDIVRTLTESEGAPRNVAYRLAHEEGS
jgi:16S rRNA (cytidine1402-2'-O)-methyltransferase